MFYAPTSNIFIFLPLQLTAPRLRKFTTSNPVKMAASPERTHFRFFDLPREVRDLVYELLPTTTKLSRWRPGCRNITREQQIQTSGLPTSTFSDVGGHFAKEYLQAIYGRPKALATTITVDFIGTRNTIGTRDTGYEDGVATLKAMQAHYRLLRHIRDVHLKITGPLKGTRRPQQSPSRRLEFDILSRQ